MRQLALVVLLVFVAGCGAQPKKAVPDPTLRPGRVSPGSVPALNHVMRTLRGKPVVVNYWATWCIPCRAEMPRIAAIARAYAATVHFLGVDVEDDTASAEKFARERNVGYPMISDPHGEIRRDQKILGLPVTQFYRADGALAFVNNGEIDSTGLTKRIGDLLIIGKPVGSAGG
jgi:cytochrome c biogenesis protein CcmG/thiol:disulfide interchange protein DsbE